MLQYQYVITLNIIDCYQLIYCFLSVLTITMKYNFICYCYDHINLYYYSFTKCLISIFLCGNILIKYFFDLNI